MGIGRKATQALWPALLAVPALGMGASASDSFESAIQPLLAQNCYSCHNEKLKSGDLNLKAFTSADAVSQNRERWETILRRLEDGEMPPKGTPRPDPAQLKTVTEWIRSEFDHADAALKPEPGRVTARRLNRSEYNNTIRDLLGVDINPAKDFPQDDSGYGFDNIGDVLSLSPVLMEQYLSAAEKVVQMALFGPGKVPPTVVRHQPVYRPGTDGGDNSRFANTLPFTLTNYDVTGLALPSALHAMHYFPAEGDYVFRVDPEGSRPAPSDPFTVAVWVDGKQAATIEDFASSPTGENFGSLEGADKTVRFRVSAGEHWVAVSALRLYEGLPAKYNGIKPNTGPAPPPRNFGPQPPPPNATPEEIAAYEKRLAAVAANGGNRRNANKPPLITDVSFRVNFVEITGPFNPKEGALPASRKKIFTCSTDDAACTRKIVSDFARRAYRHPVEAQEVTRLLTLVSDSRKRGDSFEQSIGTALEAVLVSPQFLFRIERDPKVASGNPEHAINDYELASRLSYFLWSSMPDDELLRCAEQKTLRKPDVLNAEVKRMLKDPKSHALVSDFGGQWLEFRALESVRPDVNRFGRFDDYLKMSEREETEMFFENIMREDRSVLEFLTGKYTFLNEELAEFYGIPGVAGPEFRKVDLSGTPRGGVLTQGSVLTVSSYSTRTSVVLRGKWVLENLLNAPVPPPPPNVPMLDETAVGSSGSLRHQMEQHRENAICASCHSRMDPIGFGLENFDAIGQWRTEDGKFPIDSSGSLTNGQTFKGPAELVDVLARQPGAFAGAITEKMLTYALGRGLEPYDRPAVKAITASLAQNDYRFSSLVLGIVKSLPFQERKGDRTIHVSNP
jgi:mono/diheme cytochrome c family protein